MIYIYIKGIYNGEKKVFKRRQEREMKPITAKTLVVDITNNDDRESITVPPDFDVVRNGDRFMIERRDRPVSLKNGMVSLATKFNLTEAPTRVTIKPEEFFGTIDPATIDTDDRIRVYGDITKETVKRRAQEAVAKKRGKKRRLEEEEEKREGKIPAAPAPGETEDVLKDVEDIIRFLFVEDPVTVRRLNDCVLVSRIPENDFNV